MKSLCFEGPLYQFSSSIFCQRIHPHTLWLRPTPRSAALSPPYVSIQVSAAVCPYGLRNIKPTFCLEKRELAALRLNFLSFSKSPHKLQVQLCPRRLEWAWLLLSTWTTCSWWRLTGLVCLQPKSAPRGSSKHQLLHKASSLRRWEFRACTRLHPSQLKEYSRRR